MRNMTEYHFQEQHVTPLPCFTQLLTWECLLQLPLILFTLEHSGANAISEMTYGALLDRK